MNKTRLGLSENVEGALSYILGPFSGILFFIIENKNQFVKFHALQSVLFFGIASFLNFVLNFIFRIFPFFGLWFVGFVVCGFIALVSFIFYIVLIVTAYQGRALRVPFIGDIAWNISCK